MDDNCSGYGGFKKCVFKAHMGVCGGPKNKNGGNQGTPPPPPEEDDDDE